MSNWVDYFLRKSPSEPDKPFSVEPEAEEDKPLARLEPDKSSDSIILGRATYGESPAAKGLSKKYREAHFYVIGSTRTGKSKFLHNLIRHSVIWQEGFGVIDPHGDLFQAVKDEFFGAEIPLVESIVVIDPTDKKYSVAFNPLELPEGIEAAQQANELVSAFKKLYGTSWGARLEAILRNTLILLIENGLTLTEVPLVLKDNIIRRRLLRNVKNETCREFFEGDFNRWSEHTKLEWTQSTLNKIDAFLSDNRMRQMFCSPKSSFDFQDIFDNKKVLLVNLSKGELGEEASNLLGSLLLSKIQITAMRRSGIRETERKPFYLYIDEFQNFASENFTDVINETGKYKLSLTLANQSLQQLPTELQTAALSCGLIACFRVSRYDAERLAKESFAGVWGEPLPWEESFQILQSLQNRECLVKNKITGGIVIVRTPEVIPIQHRGIPELWDEVEDMLRGWRKNIHMGKLYLRRREDIEREYHERRRLLAVNSEPQGFRRGRRTAADYETLIKGGENHSVEFKQTLRWDEREGMDKKKEHILAKSVSAFMNSEGGTLFIGITDKGEILGLENDFSVMPATKKNRDGFLLQLTQTLNNYLGKQHCQYSHISIITIQDRDICVIEIEPSGIPVYVRNGNIDEFYVRSSATAQPMSVREANEYIKTHFSRY